MIRRQLFAAAAALMLAASFAPPLMAQQPAGPPPDALSDPSLKGPEVLAFMGVKAGNKVADIIPGRFTRAESQAVGPAGKVYAVMPDEISKVNAGAVAGLKASTAGNPNIEVINGPINAIALPGGLDVVFIRQNYHDLYDKFMGPADVPAFNKKVFAALKPGGVFVIQDHVAPAGSGLAATNTTHRIDPERVKADMKAAGFTFDGESKILANPADDHSKLVFDPSIRGKTDQFLYRFKKPR
jgi:predicted methyltransferase